MTPREPRTLDILVVRIGPELMQAVDEAAEGLSMSRSDYVRTVLAVQTGFVAKATQREFQLAGKKGRKR